jgi:3-oxoacyl-[acyl-carrier-protein] synthase-3
MLTKARTIHKVALEDAPPLLAQALQSCGLQIGDIDWLIPHQTSVRAIRSGERALAEQLGAHPRHTVVTVDEYGNTASTTLFLALHRYLTDHRFTAGDKILLLSVASGLEVGIVLFEMDELEASHGHLH